MTKEIVTQFYETLDANVSIEAFGAVYDEAVVFKDPFNEIRGISAVYDIFSHMYDTLENPRFIVNEYIAQDNVAYVKWDFIFTFKGRKEEQRFEGVTRLQINTEGKVISHIDFWDAAEHMYEKMPLLGSVLRFIKRKIASTDKIRIQKD